MRALGSLAITALGLLAIAALAACDPVWAVSVELRDPGDRPVAGATVALACSENSQYGGNGFSVRSDGDGNARLGGIGSALPVGCDLFVAKPGLATLRIRYRELCPDLDGDCDRVFDLALVVGPCPGATRRGESAPRCLGYHRR